LTFGAGVYAGMYISQNYQVLIKDLIFAPAAAAVVVGGAADLIILDGLIWFLITLQSIIF
jgi:hypothetical protein